MAAQVPEAQSEIFFCRSAQRRLSRREGLLVLEVLGMHMADPVSGVLEMFSRMDAVASDPDWARSFAAPTFRVSALDVA